MESKGNKRATGEAKAGPPSLPPHPGLVAQGARRVARDICAEQIKPDFIKEVGSPRHSAPGNNDEKSHR